MKKELIVIALACMLLGVSVVGNVLQYKAFRKKESIEFVAKGLNELSVSVRNEQIHMITNAINTLAAAYRQREHQIKVDNLRRARESDQIFMRHQAALDKKDQEIKELKRRK